MKHISNTTTITSKYKNKKFGKKSTDRIYDEILQCIANSYTYMYAICIVIIKYDSDNSYYDFTRGLQLSDLVESA